MKKISLFAAMCFVALLVASCGGSEKPDPMDAWEDAMSDFEDAMEETMDEYEEVLTDEDYGSGDDMESTDEEMDDTADETADEGSDSNEWDGILDDYSDWADDYIEVIKKQKADPTDMSVMQDAASMASKAAEWSTKMSGAAADLTAEQAARLTEIQTRLASAAM